MRGGSWYPSVYGRLISVFEIFTSLNLVEVVHLDCLGERLNFGHTLLATTLLPLGVALLVLLGEGARVLCRGGSVVRSKGFKFLVIFVFFLLPSISRVGECVAGELATLQCLTPHPSPP